MSAAGGHPGGAHAGAALAVPALAFVIFVIAPLGALVYRATERGEIGKQLREPFVLDALRLSLVTSTVALFVVLALGTPLAYLLARARFPGKQLVDTVVDLPIVLPPVVAGVALLMAFGRRGVFGGSLERAGIEVAFTTTAVVLAQVFVSAPFYIRAARAGFATVDAQLEGIAYTLGASRGRTFLRVTLPLAWPALAGGAVLSWARALSEFGATMMFAGNLRGETQTMPLAVMSAMETDIYAALALSVILLAISAAVLVAFRLVSKG